MAGPGNTDRAGAVVRLELEKNRRDEVGRFTLPKGVNRSRVAPDQQRLAAWSGAAPDDLAVLDFEAGARPRPLFAVPATPRVAAVLNLHGSNGA